MALWKLMAGETVRWAVGTVEDGPTTLLRSEFSLDLMLASSAFDDSSLSSFCCDDRLGQVTVLAPIGTQEVWAAGVTYLRSRDARKLESGLDVYDAVYKSERPELFLKSVAWRVSGPNAPVGIRAESGWDVPEPELGLVVNSTGSIVGFTIGNDMSSRSIEGENPLYLPQAKFYDGSCALGPCIVPIWEAPDPSTMLIDLTVTRDDAQHYRDTVRVADMARTVEELVSWLYRGLSFPHGAFLLTGTAIVPPSEFTLKQDDIVSIEITGLGKLENRVNLSGRRGAQFPGQRVAPATVAR